MAGSWRIGARGQPTKVLELQGRCRRKAETGMRDVRNGLQPHRQALDVQADF